MGAPSVISDSRSLCVRSRDADEALLTTTVGRSELFIRVRLVRPEHDGRVARGLGAMTNEDVLAALLQAPAGTLSRVDSHFRKMTSAQVTTLIEDPKGGFWATTIVGKPLEILGVEVHADSWKVGSGIAHDWAGYAPRMVRLPKRSLADSFTLSEASLYGIGVTVEPNSHPELAPGEYSPARWSSARWLVAELLYGELLRSGTLS